MFQVQESLSPSPQRGLPRRYGHSSSPRRRSFHVHRRGLSQRDSRCSRGPRSMGIPTSYKEEDERKEDKSSKEITTRRRKKVKERKVGERKGEELERNHKEDGAYTPSSRLMSSHRRSGVTRIFSLITLFFFWTRFIGANSG